MNEFIRFWGLVFLVVVVLVTVTIFLMRKFEKYPFYKFIPTLMVWLVSIIFFVMAVFFAEPMQDLGYFVMSLITGAATFIVLIITIVLDIIQRKRKKK